MPKIPTPYGDVNAKQMKFAKMVIASNFDPDRTREAVVLAGYSTTNSAVTAARLLDHKAVRGLIVEAMQRMGITIERLMETHADALEADDPKYGQPDHRVRLQAVRMGLELLDAFPSSKVEVSGEHHVVHTLNEKALRKAEEITGEEVIDAVVIEDAALERPF